MTRHIIPGFWLLLFANLFIPFIMGCQGTHEDGEDFSESSDKKDGAGENSSFPAGKNDTGDIESIALELSNILGEVSGSVNGISAVSYQELQKILPKRVNGVSPVITDGQMIEIGGGISKVHGEYEDGEQAVTVAIIDLAAFGRLAALSLSDWLDEEIDRESDRGFERTQIFRSRTGEYPTYKKYHNERGHESCELHSWVEDRFLVAIMGDGVSMSICESARDRISFRQLEILAQAQDE